MVMRVDERAWLVVTQKKKALIGIDPLPHGIVSVRNTGKTPARHVFGNFIIEIIKNGESPHFTPVKIPHSAFVFGTLSPQRQEEIPVERSRLKPDGTTEPDMTTGSERDALTNGKAWVAIHGVVLYEDVFEVRHWVKFCGWTNPKGYADAAICAAYNDEDTN